MKLSLAVAMLIGAVTPNEIDVPDANMVNFKLKLANPEEAERAHRKYNHALVDFYDALPKDGVYQKAMYAKGADLKATYTAWHAKTKLDMEYVDPDTFLDYFYDEGNKSQKKNETIAKKKAEEEAKKKAEDAKKKNNTDPKNDTAPKNDTKIVMAEKEDKDKKDVEVDAYPELVNLKNAGMAFDNHVQHSLEALAKGENNLYWQYLPDLEYTMVPMQKFTKKTFDNYVRVGAKHQGVKLAEYTAAVKAVQDARAAVKDHLENTPGLKMFFKDKVLFKNVFLRGFAKYEGCPSLEQFEDKLKKNPNNKFTPYLKKAAHYAASLKESDRIDFNKKFKTLLEVSKKWTLAGKALDASVREYNKKLADLGHDGWVPYGEFVEKSIQQRENMVKVYQKLMALNGKEEAAQKTAEEYQDKLNDEKNANIGLIILLILIVLGTVGGVTYCKMKKKACFAEKEEEAAEGGESDKTLFKKEVKSKTNKKNNKESLMPAFKVTDEQA